MAALVEGKENPEVVDEAKAKTAAAPAEPEILKYMPTQQIEDYIVVRVSSGDLWRERRQRWR